MFAQMRAQVGQGPTRDQVPQPSGRGGGRPLLRDDVEETAGTPPPLQAFVSLYRYGDDGVGQGQGPLPKCDWMGEACRLGPANFLLVCACCLGVSPLRWEPRLFLRELC